MKKLLSLFLTCGLVLTLGACSNSPKPQDTVKNFLNSYKTQKFDELDNFFDAPTEFSDEIDFSGEFEGTDKEAQTIILKKLTDIDYKIDNETVNNDKATVKVTITANNFGEKFMEGIQEAFTLAFTLAMDENITEEEVNQKVTEAMIKPIKECEKTVTETVEIPLVQKDGKWLISTEINEDLLNALTGGILDIAEQFEDIEE